MQGEMVMYLGRVVAKEGFRVFIYGAEQLAKLVESWAEYESHISSGVWFSTKEEADKPKFVPSIEEAIKAEIKPKDKRQGGN